MSDRDPSEFDRLRTWIGRRTVSTDLISPELVRRFYSTFNLDREGAVAPPGIHWCLSPDVGPSDALSPDGHPQRGNFMPPVELPRRMWAGGRLRLTDSLRLGDEVRRESSIKNVSLKQGRTGRLCFVTVEHEYSTQRGLAISEQQDIVYRGLEDSRVSTPVAPQSDAAAVVSHAVDANPVVLFRYSALTFNGHRIHYDRDYAMNVEGYPGLVVHGPLQATTLLLLAERMFPDRRIQSFAYRGVRPLFAGTFFVKGRMHASKDRGEFWTLSTVNGVHMKAEACW